MGDAAQSYTLLTIGDGLVAQIPALVISTAAGVIVTRVANDEDVGQQMVSQLFTNPRVMVLSAAVLGLFGLVPGMPNFVFLLFTVGLLALAWWLRGKEEKAPAEATPVKMPENNQAVEATWNDVQLEDSLGMEVGYRLIPMVDFQQDGELLGRIRSIRKKFAQDMGFLPPVVHIRDNMDLPPARYRILMKGVEVGSGDAYPGRWLAINPGTAAGSLPGNRLSIRPLAWRLSGLRAAERAGADPGLHRGGGQYGCRNAPEPPDWSVCAGAVWSSGSATTA
jgi:flagellar biosynthesis protein FlhA